MTTENHWSDKAIERLRNLIAVQNRIPTVLIVDDDHNDTLLMFNLLSKYRCSVEYAIEGNDAIRKIEATMPDLVFLDLKMPKPNGLDILSRFRDSADTVFIAVTGYITDKITEDALAMGALTAVAKPVTDEFVRRIFQHVKL